MKHHFDMLHESDVFPLNRIAWCKLCTTCIDMDFSTALGAEKTMHSTPTTSLLYIAASLVILEFLMH